MADVGKGQGGKAASPTKEPIEGGTPKGGGYDSAPRGSKMNFDPLHGHGGSTPGAH